MDLTVMVSFCQYPGYLVKLRRPLATFMMNLQKMDKDQVYA